MPRKTARAEHLPKRTYTLIPPQLRERAAVLVLDEGCTISDVADIMNVNRSALSKVVQKARKERALEPPLAAVVDGAAAPMPGDAAAAANAAAAAANGSSAARPDLSRIGRGKAAINRHKAATSVSFEGLLCFPGPSLLTFYKYLHRTKKSMDICVDSITCIEIAKAVLAAKGRGVRVRIITNDKERYAPDSVVPHISDAGVAVRAHESMRHRFCLLDNMTLLHGSFSWSRSDATEDMVVRTGGPLINRYRFQFDSLWAAYEPPTAQSAAMANANSAAVAAAAAAVANAHATNAVKQMQARAYMSAAAAAAARDCSESEMPKRQPPSHEQLALAPMAMSTAAMPHHHLQQQSAPASVGGNPQHELAPAQLAMTPEMAHMHLATLAGHDHLGGAARMGDDAHRLA